MSGIRSLKYLEKIISEVEEEIFSRPKDSNLGKKGCLRRMKSLRNILNEEILLEEEIKRIMKIFKGSFINSHNELILIPKINLFFSLNDILTEFDLKVKVLSWATRITTRGSKRDYYRNYTKKKINEFLGTKFDDDDFWLIYSELGNNINLELSSKFIFYNFDIKILKEK
ncbi:MAG: hypothetical protein ACRCX2_21785 [Paraclostridium sp.]